MPHHPISTEITVTAAAPLSAGIPAPAPTSLLLTATVEISNTPQPNGHRLSHSIQPITPSTTDSPPQRCY
ncbi:hypothetical protein FH972_019496 [Carpinus fangiana]|uniref:Uncharacterized protein n=1 Tax=Carpinus fangiana TaxID=176857 RepID=A0A5N6RTK5_9ROSI|nr:hypothetical protein FH972_019496 [Carpinus fangiana]